MANLTVGGATWAEGVFKSDSQSSFPCMDSNYRVLRWSFTFPKEFASFAALLDFEQDTIPGYFSSREYTVIYGGESETSCILQSYKRVNIISPGPPITAEYEAIFVKVG